MFPAAQRGNDPRLHGKKGTALAVPFYMQLRKCLALAACEQVADEREYPKDGENVNEQACSVCNEFAHNPQQEKNTGDSKKHIVLPRCLLPAGMRTNT